MSDAFRGIRDGVKVGETVPWPDGAASAIPEGSIFDLLQIRPTHVGPGAARAEMVLGPRHLNQRGLCQGGVLVALADATAGWATYCLVPEDHAFTTLELHTNLLGRARLGDTLVAVARPVHAGRSTAVLAVEVMRHQQEERDGPDPRLTAMFTCTQLILPPG